MDNLKRVVSGMRPTGSLHIGHLEGALTNWLELQDKYNCLFFVADWHALTTNYDDKKLKDHVYELVVDWLSVGIDPEKCILFVQSHIKEHAELFLLLSMITPLGWLERCPTYKEQLKQLDTRRVSNYGFLGYPVLQTADIITYNANFVPVGEDQIPHLELAREIVRRFHSLYGVEVFEEPQPLLTRSSRILGVDGRKMSKSYDNCIYLKDTDEDTTKKVKSMITDPNRIKATDKGNPDVCLVYDLHKAFNKDEQEICIACKKGEIGCVECKKRAASILNAKLTPIRERREKFSMDISYIQDILEAGDAHAREICKVTLDKVRKIMLGEY